MPTHPALHADFDFIPSNDLGSDLDDSSPSRDRNKIYDPGICIEVESMRILATLSPVINTLFPFSSKNEDKVFNYGVLAYKEKSPPYSLYRGLKALQLSSKSPMLIHGDNTPDLGTGYSLKDEKSSKNGQNRAEWKSVEKPKTQNQGLDWKWTGASLKNYKGQIECLVFTLTTSTKLRTTSYIKKEEDRSRSM
ncbi:hypothetical protein Tco_0426105 [Tanacetum coccineum]